MNYDPHVRWLFVSDKDDERAEERIKRYLYNNATVTSVLHDYVERFDAYRVSMLVVIAQGGGNLTSAAQQQADRLRSGMIQVKVCETYLQAVEEYHDYVGTWKP